MHRLFPGEEARVWAVHHHGHRVRAPSALRELARIGRMHRHQRVRVAQRRSLQAPQHPGGKGRAGKARTQGEQVGHQIVHVEHHAAAAPALRRRREDEEVGRVGHVHHVVARRLDAVHEHGDPESAVLAQQREQREGAHHLAARAQHTHAAQPSQPRLARRPQGHDVHPPAGHGRRLSQTPDPRLGQRIRLVDHEQGPPRPPTRPRRGGSTHGRTASARASTSARL